ncbi:MoaD/ThiS family protein [Pollutibacter soli]|uniref:MoaD/ThiS family protein n=1 Tax=Pollutibacter soli TaxID=3034157 RepID=UPI003013BB47
MDIQVFGRLTEVFGADKITVDPVNDTDSLLKKLRQDYPAIGETGFIIAVDKKQVRENVQLSPGMMIVLMPPFSGG